MATISTHMGHDPAPEHNRRNRAITDKETHIDPQGHYEIWLDVPPREMYDRIFGKAVKEYNEKQKREDRKIKSYYNQVAKSAKKHTVYEEVAGVYGDEVDPKTARAILKEYIKGWKKANPNMILTQVTLHADEDHRSKGIHIHILFIPISHGYTNSLSVQTSISRGLAEQGVRRQGKKSAQEVWTRSENDRLEAICQQHGLKVEHPMRDQNAEHKATALYKVEKTLEEKQSELQQTKKAVKHAHTELQAAQKFNDSIKSQLEQSKKRLEAEIEKKRAQLEQLKGEVQEHSEQAEQLRAQIRQSESRLSALKAKAKEAEARLAEAEKKAVEAEKIHAMAEDLRKEAIKHMSAMNAADLFQWSENKVNGRTGKTLLESYCDDQGIDYTWLIDQYDLTPNPNGGYNDRER